MIPVSTHAESSRIYCQTVEAGIAHACDRATRDQQKIFVYGDTHTVWVRNHDEGIPDGALQIGWADRNGSYHREDL